ncbi:MAG: 3-oxoacyl-ACP synthase [Chloroflexota bacterium]
MIDQRPGIVSVGTWLPQSVMEAADIAAETGLPEWVIRTKMGITRKHVADRDVHPNEMALYAAQDCLSRTDIDPADIDVVLCTTEEWREYLCWTSGIDLAYRLGATNAWALDIHARCVSTVSALKLAKSLMFSDPEINTVLIAGGYRLSDLINFKNKHTSFMWNIGTGAGALLLRKGHGQNILLGTHQIADGYMSRHVVVPASGTVQFPTDEAVADKQFFFDLVEPELMKNRLNAVSMDNWLTCVDEALRKSGSSSSGNPLTRSDIDFLNCLLIKPSAYKQMLQELGLSREQGVYLGHIGHIGEQDMMFGIREGLAQGRLNDGDLMAVVAAGIGYVWGAAIVRWGKPPYLEGRESIRQRVKRKSER